LIRKFALRTIKKLADESLDFICQLFVLMDYFNGDTFSVPSISPTLFPMYQNSQKNAS